MTIFKWHCEKQKKVLLEILEQVPMGIGIGGEKIGLVNERYRRIKEKYEGVIGEDFLFRLEHPAFNEDDRRELRKLRTGSKSEFRIEKEIEDKRGTKFWFHMSMLRFINGNNSENSFLCVMEDITKQKIMEQTLLEIEKSKAILLQNLPGMAYRCAYDREWTMEFVSNGCLSLTGYEPEDLIGNRRQSFNNLIVPKYREHLWNQWEKILEEQGQMNEEYEILTSEGQTRWVYELGQPIFNKEGSVEALEGILIDISKQKEEEHNFKYLSEHDSLTDLYNRRYFEKLLNENLDEFRILKKQGAVILIMIHNLNQLNLINGFGVTEKIIVDLTNRLKNYCNKECSLFQISTERYAFLLEEYGDVNQLKDFAKQIFEEIIQVGCGTKLDATMGIIELKEEPDVERVLKYASIAAQEAAESSEKIRFFCKEMEDSLIRKEGVKDVLNQYFTQKKGDLVAFYQPIIDIKSNKIYGFEALARFFSQEYGLISPLEFIPIAEEAGMIFELGKEIFIQSCIFLNELEKKGLTNISIAVNISMIQLVHKDFVELIQKTIEETKANPRNITLEITESVFKDDYQEMNQRLGEIRKLGIRISIDDFGTGYSSLARERELMVDYLKIDKYFIDKILISNQEESITADIISMAHKLGHRVVAEGVEEQIQMNYLMMHKCNYVQGYYFSKPLSKKDAFDKIMEWNEPD